MAGLLEVYAPNLWDAIGGIIDQIMINIRDILNPPSRGEKQEEIGDMFQLGPIADVMENTGGDYGIVSEWAEYGGGDPSWGPWACRSAHRR